MNSSRALVILAVGLVLTGPAAFAQDLSRYRAYVLESSLESVTAANGAREADVKTLHERPVKIQELQWRAPYASFSDKNADPVREIAFTFLDDALYQLVVSYARDRTDGLTNDDVIQSVSDIYGEPALTSGRPIATLADSVVLAQWENAASLLTLLRRAFSPEFQLILVSKPLSTRARSAIREAIRLDAVEAPRRESEQRKKEVADANAARDKARQLNKPAFRP